MKNSFPKAARLRSRRDFQRFVNQSKRASGRWIIIESRAGRSVSPRLGVTVTRKYGKAHDRNRFKRLVREAFRHCQHQLERGLEIVVRPRTAALEASASDIAGEMRELLIRKRGSQELGDRSQKADL